MLNSNEIDIHAIYTDKEIASMTAWLKKPTPKNVFLLYDGSLEIEKAESRLNISADFVEMKLAKCHERRAGDYWAAIRSKGVELRFTLDYGVGLVKGKCFKIKESIKAPK
jgi:hypothetical protein